MYHPAIHQLMLQYVFLGFLRLCNLQRRQANEFCKFSYDRYTTHIHFWIYCPFTTVKCVLKQSYFFHREYLPTICGNKTCDENCSNKNVTNLRPFTPYQFRFEVFTEKSRYVADYTVFFNTWTRPLDIVFAVSEVGANYVKLEVKNLDINAECILDFSAPHPVKSAINELIFKQFTISGHQDNVRDLRCVDRMITPLQKDTLYNFVLRTNSNGGKPQLIQAKTSKSTVWKNYTGSQVEFRLKFKDPMFINFNYVLPDLSGTWLPRDRTRRFRLPETQLEFCQSSSNNTYKLSFEELSIFGIPYFRFSLSYQEKMIVYCLMRKTIGNIKETQTIISHETKRERCAKSEIGVSVIILQGLSEESENNFIFDGSWDFRPNTFRL
ncbi:hypothetical protein RF11_13178 [Thelohanellus kitauei]|uniref:Uncharacterized protein n=1 Tax=Thelohanellus kitauei TaxID=669202 RepID=A0A0C2MUC0_THEKT|nr:hypothetical protein RF11_13178 [Thelohanellus kitauei]